MQVRDTYASVRQKRKDPRPAVKLISVGRDAVGNSLAGRSTQRGHHESRSWLCMPDATYASSLHSGARVGVALALETVASRMRWKAGRMRVNAALGRYS